MKSLKVLVASAVMVFGFQTFANPVVIGDPSKGTPITTVTDGDSKVEITTTGISVEEGSKKPVKNGVYKEIADSDEGQKSISFTAHSNWLSDLEDIIVPIAFFLFLLAVILGRRYLSSRNDQRRLELLRTMVEKGQPLPETIVSQILYPQAKPESESESNGYKRTRNAFGFSLAGVLLLGYAVATKSWDSTGLLVTGLVFTCLGFSGLAALYLNKNEEKLSG